MNEYNKALNDVINGIDQLIEKLEEKYLPRSFLSYFYSLVDYDQLEATLSTLKHIKKEVRNMAKDDCESK